MVSTIPGWITYQCLSKTASISVKKTKTNFNERILLKEVALRFLTDKCNLQPHVYNAKWEGLFIDIGSFNLFLQHALIEVLQNTF